ncbi:Protein virC2 [Agrobacterium tumefaciens str. Kerr 14]|uniref:Protein virC2 n=1 Tax=Agrobacterium tumefaciens str. Kerr 14 TaxID=1183424 RepID=A0A1S7SB56_AGRTU|nr:VirC2 family conjugal transfer protein [Agrobacterium tumefaciens]CUX65747.1 Protein virC2 [Agrobacterium tumefaciens str. Kerr 14]
MGIRKPNLSVKEARQLASVRSAASTQLTEADDRIASTHSPKPAAAEIGGPQGAAGLNKPVQRTKQKGTRSATGQNPPQAPPAPSAPVKGDMQTTPAGSMASPVSHGIMASASMKGPDKMQIFLSAPIPAEGVSTVYPVLTRQYGPQKALQMILRKAMSQYEKLLRNGQFQGLVEAYAINPDAPEPFVQTSRMMPRAIVAIARAHFDPLGFESTRAFGRKLGTAALAAFFVAERR